jgi:hypothetical protein
MANTGARMSDQTKKVTCGAHGVSYPAFVCHHLAEGGEGKGFFWAEDASDDPCPDAWCAECDKVMMSRGGWDNESEGFAQVTMICAGCYQATKLRNWRPE